MKITSQYKTYTIYGYSFSIPGSSQRSAGGVHQYQIRRGKNGYLVRIEQSNGAYSDYSVGAPARPDQVEQALKSDM